jgi:hypothetical protein
LLFLDLGSLRAHRFTDPASLGALLRDEVSPPQALLPFDIG